MEITLDLMDVEVNVEFDLSGCYRPATYFEPAEYPELEITGVFIYGKVQVKGKTEDGRMCIRHLLDDDQIDFLEGELWEYLNNMKEES